jgi:hypothetical protein
MWCQPTMKSPSIEILWIFLMQINVSLCLSYDDWLNPENFHLNHQWVVHCSLLGLLLLYRAQWSHSNALFLNLLLILFDQNIFLSSFSMVVENESEQQQHQHERMNIFIKKSEIWKMLLRCGFIRTILLSTYKLY